MNRKLLLILLLSVIISMLLMSSCAGKNASDEADIDDRDLIDELSKEYGGEDSEVSGKSDTTGYQSDSSVELPIYTIDTELQCVPSTALVSSSEMINASLIVNEVVSNFTKKVEIDKVEEGTDYVAVYFGKDTAPVSGVSKDMEEAMLDCIAYSLIDNLDYCSKVLYRCGDSAYASTNISLDYDEAYATK